MLTYAEVVTVTLQYLQDTGAATYDATEIGDWVVEEKKRLSTYDKHIVDILYKVESRTGTDTTGTASKLTDTTKSQFVSTDTDKVVHNLTEDTWAVVTAYDSTSVLSLSSDIMNSGDKYEIYNKDCRNKRQLYIGDIGYNWVETVEYPVGTRRNLKKISRDVIELAVEDDTVKDSNSTLTVLNPVYALVRFALPHVLCRLADLAGAVHTTAAAGAKTMQVKSFTDAEIANVGDEFKIAGHMSTYILTAGVTMANQGGAEAGSTIYFYPPLESEATAADVVTFTQSSLNPRSENYLIRLVQARAKISDAERLRLLAIADMATGRALINTTPTGGARVPGDYLQYANTGIKIANDNIVTARDEQRSLIGELMSLIEPASANSKLPRT